ncbi:uncharacterized protein LOC129732308 [Wyeomyia smithii]|uniref:uncharacterized protein LOC129732308 n=1 Tax=Wyeomyia smithii TaxID=174621 RepID=UPI002467C1C7|nr:uncharacterized protein LOC129732308 [Wyeomyia smithii]XP_055549082.1 uncharacterized protein LOC129732308 [Wyeomyia smithii]
MFLWARFVLLELLKTKFCTNVNIKGGGVATALPCPPLATPMDKEAYAIIFGVKKYFQYLYGRRFILVTDNHAVTKIFSEHKGLLVMSALRVQHYATYLQSFDYKIRFRKSTDHANADAMSRFPVKLCGSENIIEESDVVEMNHIDTLPVTAEELSQATSEDKNIQTLLQGLRYGQAVDGKDRFGIDQTEFTIQNGCLLRGIRVYVPVKFRERVLAELHSTHFGLTRTKSLARGVCWWMGIDREIEQLISNCAECQSIRSEPTKVLPHPWEPATGDKVRVRDFLSANKWQFRQVVTKLGKMRYSIRLDEGRLWERHVDHMCGVGSNLDSSSRAGSKKMAPEFANPTVTTASSGDNRSCEVQPVVGTSFTSESQAPPPVQPAANGGQQAVVSEGARMGNVEPVQPIRRSNRVLISERQGLNIYI